MWRIGLIVRIGSLRHEREHREQSKDNGPHARASHEYHLDETALKYNRKGELQEDRDKSHQRQGIGSATWLNRLLVSDIEM